MLVLKVDNKEKDAQIPEGKSKDFACINSVGRVHEVLRAGLYIVATPIGNLRDITLRALDTLRAADVIMCEDTRVTRKLLGAYSIKGKLQSYNDHSDDGRRAAIVDMVAQGQAVVLVSDAGMPLVSDPGYKLVRDCVSAELPITTIPGANAPLCALQLSGLPSDQFSFIGFLPNKSKARKDFLRKWMSVESTLIAFESAQRLVDSLAAIEEVLGDRQIAVVREITKLYEEAKRGRPAELLEYYAEKGQPKGEIVLVIAPPVPQELSEEVVLEKIRNALNTMKTKDAATFVADRTGLKKNDLYALALKVSKGEI